MTEEFIDCEGRRRRGVPGQAGGREADRRDNRLIIFPRNRIRRDPVGRRRIAIPHLLDRLKDDARQ